MTDAARPRPLKEAGRITLMLDTVLGADRFDRAPVDIEAVALEYSANVAPDGRIHEVVERDIPGCVGALVCSETKPRQWAIMYNLGQSDGRRAFTIGHEFGHYVLHRQMIETDSSYDLAIYCDEEAVTQRNGQGIEQEADALAAALLMPFHDFRAQLPAKAQPDFEKLGALAKRYGVSLTAAILRWLEYTETRAMLVVQRTRVRALCSFASQHVELNRIEQAAPFVIGMDDFEAFLRRRLRLRAGGERAQASAQSERGGGCRGARQEKAAAGLHDAFLVIEWVRRIVVARASPSPHRKLN